MRERLWKKTRAVLTGNSTPRVERILLQMQLQFGTSIQRKADSEISEEESVLEKNVRMPRTAT